MSSSTPPLRSLWLTLTGGEQGCSRRAFFPRYLVAVILLRALSCTWSPSVPVVTVSNLDHSISFGRAILDALLALSATVSFSSGCVSSGPLTGMLCAFVPSIPMPLPEFVDGRIVGDTELPRLIFYLGWPFAVGAGALAFGLAWRRLRDAGLSPLYLLLILYPLLPGLLAGGWLRELSTLPGGALVIFCIYHINEFYLFRLFCKPTRRSP